MRKTVFTISALLIIFDIGVTIAMYDARERQSITPATTTPYSLAHARENPTIL